MNSAMKEKLQPILDKIKEYDRIMLFRHIRIDGDCVGATRGLKEILRLTYPEKEIVLTDDEHSDYLAFAGEDDAPVDDAWYGSALGIVLDTASQKRIANQKYRLCKELIKIDHHIEVEPYGDLSWVEEERSSACEMVAAFYDAFRDELKINRQAATHIYMGMVTDSGRFQYDGVTGDTLRYAGLMLDQGIDTAVLYANLYLKEYHTQKFKAHVLENMTRTENGVIYYYVSRAVMDEFGLSFEDASASVSYMDSIKGCLCWLAFIESGDSDGSIRVRLRSRFVSINGVAEHFHGGGHACASGATVYGTEEMRALIDEADATVKAYKETHTGWL